MKLCNLLALILMLPVSAAAECTVNELAGSYTIVCKDTLPLPGKAVHRLARQGRRHQKPSFELQTSKTAVLTMTDEERTLMIVSNKPGSARPGKKTGKATPANRLKG